MFLLPTPKPQSADPKRRKRETAHLNNRVFNFKSPDMEFKVIGVHRPHRVVEKRKRRQHSAKMNAGARGNKQRLVDPIYTRGFNFMIHLKSADGLGNGVRKELVALAETVRQAISYEIKVYTKTKGRLKVPYKIGLMEESDFIITMMMIDRSKIIKMFRTIE